MAVIRSLIGGRRGLVALAAVVSGIALVTLAWHGQQTAPSPNRAGQVEPHPSTTTGAPDAAAGRSADRSDEPSTRRRGHQPLPYSEPVSLRIPAIGVHTPVFGIGKAPDGTLAVPQPGPRLNQAAWFEGSPAPGQAGPSIIEGHVDSTEGPSVFFKLGDIAPGDKVIVRRHDDTTAVFTVNAVRDFPKTGFPTRLVYGGKDLTTPQLRLITCSDFDPSIGHHTGNEVVFAHLTSVRSARVG